MALKSCNCCHTIRRIGYSRNYAWCKRCHSNAAFTMLDADKTEEYLNDQRRKLEFISKLASE